MSEYKPLGITSVDYDALSEGVPLWLKTSLLNWVQGQCRWYHSGGRGYGGKWVWQLDLLREVERNVRVKLTDAPMLTDGLSAWHGIENLAEKYPDYFLELINLLLSKLDDDDEAGELQQHLEEGGSAWTVAKRGSAYGLERRVDHTVVAAAERAIALGNSSGQLLENAWVRAFGVNPNPGDAYDDAIKAVEAAGVSVVSPKNSKATLGTMIKDMTRVPHKWSFALPVAQRVDPIEMVTNMMEALWTGQSGRHGTTGAIHVENTQQEAEAALMLAVPLVQWFTDGTISRVP